VSVGSVSRSMSRKTALAAFAAMTLAVSPTRATPLKETVVQTDTLGMSLVTYDLVHHHTTTVADSTVLSELVGAHYFFADGWRVGMSIEFAELLSKPPPGGSRFTAFGFLPQVGWHFYGPLFTALVFAVLPRTGGGAHTDLGVQGVFGVSAPIAERVNLTVAVEVPFRFYLHDTVGVIGLLGLSFEL